jgi:uncharacterized protein (TIGR03663 family)
MSGAAGASREMARRSLPTVLAVLAAGALVARLLLLDARVAHWDEARVAFWTLQYLQRGAWSYHPIVHGPFLFHVNRVVFATLGATDVTMRLVVAVVGGTLPLSAWLFRTRLTRAETVALGVVLAASPLFLFYSRFMRNDLLLAAFALTSLGLAVRAWDTDRSAYLVAAGGTLGLAFTTKENAVLYLLCWAGAAALLVGWRRWHADVPRRGLVEHADRFAAEATSRFGGWPSTIGWAATAVLAWLVVVVLFYASRAPAGVGLWRVVEVPSLFPAIVTEATVGSARQVVETWVTDGYRTVGGRTALYFVHLVGTLLVGAAALVAFAVYGTALEARRAGGPRPLVALTVAWAGLSLLGYPFAADMAAPWLAVHVATPLAVPAAVGLAAAVDRARRAAANGDRQTARRVGLALLVLGSQAAVVGATTSYLAPNSDVNLLAQPAQPDADLRATTRDLTAVADGAEKPTALYVGPYFDPDHRVRRFPLRWYLARDGFATGHVSQPTDLGPDPPHVVVALTTHRSELDRRLPGYRARTHEFDSWVPREPAAPFVEVVVYVDPDATGPDSAGSAVGERSG